MKGESVADLLVGAVRHCQIRWFIRGQPAAAQFLQVQLVVRVNTCSLVSVPVTLPLGTHACRHTTEHDVSVHMDGHTDKIKAQKS